MTTREPHFFNVSSRLELGILVLVVCQLSGTSTVDVGCAARHLMLLDTFFLIMACWAIPYARNETTRYDNEDLRNEEKQKKKHPPTYDVRQETWRDGRTWCYHWPLWMAVDEVLIPLNPQYPCLGNRTINVRDIDLWQETITTDHTPTNSISTLIENARLKAVLCFQPLSSSVMYILYAKGTCWWLHTGKRPTCGIRSGSKWTS